jgi:hypothetical protein
MTINGKISVSKIYIKKKSDIMKNIIQTVKGTRDYYPEAMAVE